MDEGRGGKAGDGGQDWAIQVMETARSEDDALQILAGLMVQDGFRGGRLHPPSPIYPDWRVQAVMDANGEAPSGWLPDGCRHVLILPVKSMEWARRPLGDLS